MIDHVNALGLPVRDVETRTQFYRDVLGFRLNHRDDVSAFLSIDGKSGGLVLGWIALGNVAELTS